MSERRPRDGDLFTEPVEEPEPDGARQKSQFGIELIAVTIAVFLIVAASVGAWPHLPIHAALGQATTRGPGRQSPTPPSPGQPPAAAGGGVAVAPSPSPGTAGAATPTPAPVANASPSPAPPPPSPASGPTPTPTPTQPPPWAPPVAPPDCSASSSPGGVITIQVSSNRARVTFDVSGMLAGCSYAVGLFKDTCGSQASLLTGFPALTATSSGTDTETISSDSSLSGIPAGSSLRIGAAGTTSSGSAEAAAACANTPQDRTITSSNPYTTHIH